MTARTPQIKTIIYLILFALISAFYPSISAGDPDVLITPTPTWVEKAEVKSGTNKAYEHLPNGEYFLLVDRQINAQGDLHEFNHFAIELKTPAAIENNSQLSFTFSPSHQTLLLHEIKILRNNKTISHLSQDKIKLLQRERELENLIIDGEWTATIILDDIRKGDILEYSYSRIGQNKALDNHFSTSFNLEWTVPVHQVFYRLLWPNNRKLFETPVNTELTFKKTNTAGHIEYTYHEFNVDGLSLESEYPEWYSPWKRINFSDTSDWREIVDWLKPKYLPPDTLSPGINNIVTELRNQYNTKSQQAAAALHFVQDEIRYLGIEIGSRGFNPNPPDETLSKRYGDCKDKSILLVTLLDALGIKAYPALVNTQYGEILDKGGPRTNAFDHVLVKAVIDNRTYWLDPTITLQKGHLGQFYQPDYGYALVIADNQKNLTRMNTSAKEHTLEIIKTFDLRSGVNQPSTLKITSKYTGLDAENFRSNLTSKGSKKLEQEYLDYYSRYYPNLGSTSSLLINDIAETNQIITEEEYSSQNIWYNNQDNNQYEFDIYSEALYSYLKTPETLKRTAPYKYIYPANTKQIIHVLLPETWNIENESKEIESPYLKFKRSADYDNKKLKLTLTYQIESKVKHIAPENMDDFINVINSIRDEMDFGLTYGYQPVAQHTRKLVTPQTGFLEIYEYEIIVGLFIAILFLISYSIFEYRIDQRHQNLEVGSIFYPVNPVKFFILSILTFNLYNIFWFYKNWSQVKLTDKVSIIPWGRALFHSLWYYPLYKHIRLKHSDKPSNSLKYALLAIFYFILMIVSNSDTSYDFIAIMSVAILTLPLVTLINNLNSTDSEAYKYNSRWRPRHLALLMIFTISTTFYVALITHTIPDDLPVDGNALWQDDINYIENTNLIPYNEKIVLFYSDGLLTYKNSGTGFTDNRIFSYSRNSDDHKLEFNYAEYENIADIKHRPSHIYDKGEITITTNDNIDFSILISTSNKSDETFYNTLKSRWEHKKQQHEAMNENKENVLDAIRKIRSILQKS